MHLIFVYEYILRVRKREGGRNREKNSKLESEKL